jgi:hypothetical protein
MEDDPSENLHVEGDHVPGELQATDLDLLPLQKFTRMDPGSERFGKERIERLSSSDTIFEFLSFPGKVGKLQGLNLRRSLDPPHLMHKRPEPFKLLLIRIPEQSIEEIEESHTERIAALEPATVPRHQQLPCVLLRSKEGRKNEKGLYERRWLEADRFEQDSVLG